MQSNYFVGLDINRDAYFAKGAVAGNALNLVDNPAQLSRTRFGSTANPPTYTRDFYNTEQSYHWEFTTGTASNAAMLIGNADDHEYSTWIPANTQITVAMEFRGITNYTGEMLRFTAAGRGGGSGSNTASTEFELTASWQRVSVVITPTTEHLLLLIERITTTTDVTFQMRKYFVVLGTSLPTNFNTGAASDFYDDITPYVQSMSWNNGMDHYDQTVSAGSRATIVLDNRDRLFYQDDDFATEELTNGDFATWLNANSPTGWAGTNLSANAQTTEVGSDELHGGTGTGALNLYATSRVMVSCRQDTLTPRQRYKVEFSIGASSYTGGVRFFMGTTDVVWPISRLYTIPGVYTFYFTAHSYSQFYITNNRYPCDITLEFVRLTPVPQYAGLGKETLVSIRSETQVNGELQMWIGRVTGIQPSGGTLAMRTVTLECVDAMQEFGDLEYRPSDVYAGNTPLGELRIMFREMQLLWPYAKDYWMLDTHTLGVDTWLADETPLFRLYTVETYSIDFATASASNSEKGISASAFVRDVMALEIGGRFFIDSRTGQFYALAHDYDSAFTTSTTITDDDFDGFEMVYGADVVNTVGIWYKQKRLGSGNIVLWSSQDDIVIPAGTTKTITGRYFDPANEMINVSAVSTAPIVRDVDFVVSPAKNQHRVIVTVDAGGQSATFKIENQRVVDVTLTTLQIRGFPLYALTDESIEVQNADSVLKNNVQKRDYNMPLISDSDTAIAIATGLTSLRGEAFDRLQSISFVLNKSQQRMTYGLGRSPGVPLTISAPSLNHNQRYRIIGERHTVTAGGEDTHTVTWILKPMKLFNYWVLGQDGFSELGETTVLMP